MSRKASVNSYSSHKIRRSGSHVSSSAKVRRLGMKGIQKEFTKVDRTFKETNIYIDSKCNSLEERFRLFSQEEGSARDMLEERLNGADQFCEHLEGELQVVKAFYEGSKREQVELKEVFKRTNEHLGRVARELKTAFDTVRKEDDRKIHRLVQLESTTRGLYQDITFVKEKKKVSNPKNNKESRTTLRS